MRLSRQKKNGSGGTAEAMQSRLEKVFKLPGESTSLNVFTRDDKGRLQYLDSIPLSDVTASTLLDVIKEGYGGGRFQIVPMGGDKKAGESFEVSVHGESKLTRKKTPDDSESGQKRSTKRTETDKEVAELREELLFHRVREEIQKAVGTRNGSGEVVESILKNLPQIVAGVSGLFGNRESASDMLEKISTIWRNVESSMPQSDPIEQAKSMAELIFSIVNQAKPPVSTTGAAHTGGGWSSFLASVFTEIEKRYLGAMPAMSAGGGAVPGLASAGPGFAGSPGASSQENGPSEKTGSSVIGGFPGGVRDGFPGEVRDEQTGTEQPPNIVGGFNMKSFDMKSMGVDPQARLQEMLLSRADAEDVAEHVVYLLNFVGTFAVPDSPMSTYMKTFFAHPGLMFDQVAPLIPELQGASAQYLSDLRDAIVEEVEVYARNAREQTGKTAAAGADEVERQADEGGEKTLTPQQREAHEKANTESEQAAEKVEDAKPESEVREEAPA